MARVNDSWVESPTTFIIDGQAFDMQPPREQVNERVNDNQQEPMGSGDEGILKQPDSTEIGQALERLNEDKIDPETRMSGIDMRARLHPIESSAVLALDSLVGLSVYPQSVLTFTRQKKRLSVSDKGKGREEIVQIVGGKRESDERKGGGMMDSMKGMLGK